MPGRGDFSDIPVLDVSPLYQADPKAIETVARTLRGYLENVGFLYVVGHPIQPSEVEAVRNAGKAFFALPDEEKLKLRIDRNFRGYLPFAGFDDRHLVRRDGEQAEPERIHLLHARDRCRRSAGEGRATVAGSKSMAGRKGAARIPVHHPGLCRSDVHTRPQDGRRHSRVAGLASAQPRSLLRGADTFLRLLHYPTQPAEEGLFGSAPHTDYGFITLLAQDDVGGLEVKNKDGDWIPAPPMPDRSS